MFMISHEVNFIGVLRHPKKGLLLLRRRDGDWAFAGSADLTPGEDWKAALSRGLKESGGIETFEILQVLHLQSFPSGTVDKSAKFGVFVLCETESYAVELPPKFAEMQWVKSMQELAELPLFHPAVKEVTKMALRER